MTTVVNNCIEFAYFFDVTNGNPNGDPDAANAPRQDYETGIGLVSDVCLKRKVRNYVEMVKGKAPNAIYVTEGSVLDDKHADAYNALGIDPKSKKDDKAGDLTKWMCQQYFDVRVFGALMVGDLNCGKVRGPMQIGMAKSVEPIVPVQMSITRMAATKEEKNKENKTMGNKWIVPYGLYRVHGYFNAPLAAKSGASEEDMKLFWNALREMWHYDKSAARPEMEARSLVILKHPGELRSAKTPELSDVVSVERITDAGKPARAWSDYHVTIHHDGLPNGVELVQAI
jgi:CRISPR-associated protein Csd2